MPYAKTVRGYSFFGYSFVYVIFADGTDLYWARSRVLERLNYVSRRLPAGVTPSLGPDATGVGWVYEYALVDRSGKRDLAELRSIQDWYLRYELQAVPGVAEVALGGAVSCVSTKWRSIPTPLPPTASPSPKCVTAIQRSNNDVGGRLIEMAETEFMVRGRGYIESIEDLEQVAVGTDGRGTPVLLRDLANIHAGPELRRGVTDLNGRARWPPGWW